MSETKRTREKLKDAGKKMERKSDREINSVKTKARVGIEMFTSRHFVLMNIIKCDMNSVSLLLLLLVWP